MSDGVQESMIAIVSGANRGIGLAVVEQLAHAGCTTYLGSRSLDRGRNAAEPLRQRGLDVRPLRLDVAETESVHAAIAAIEADAGRLDIVVNNAAINYDTHQTVLDADLELVSDTFDTNVLGAWRLVDAALPLLRRSAGGRIVNVSSGNGELSSMTGSTPAYSLSKLGLNGLTLMLASALRREGILVNAVCPGWVATDMGGAGGRPVADGAAGIVWAALLPDHGPTGGFFRDRRPVDW